MFCSKVSQNDRESNRIKSCRAKPQMQATVLFCSFPYATVIGSNLLLLLPSSLYKLDRSNRSLTEAEICSNRRKRKVTPPSSHFLFHRASIRTSIFHFYSVIYAEMERFSHLYLLFLFTLQVQGRPSC